MKSGYKVFFIFVLSTFLVSISPNYLEAQSTDIPPQITLDIPVVTQTNTEWCWVAASEMVLRYRFNREVRLCDLFQSWTGLPGDICCRDLPSCNRPAQGLQEIRNLLIHNGLGSFYAPEPVPERILYAYLQHNRPIVIQVRRTGGTHAVVIRGVSIEPNPAEPGEFHMIVIYNDPGDGTINRIPYDTLREQWIDSLIINAPH
jgi:hypothetical protein